MDFRAIFDAANAASDALHRAARIAELERLVRLRECGDCALWMTPRCPREKPQPIGRSRGPSCGEVPCSIWVEKSWCAETRAKRQAELDALKQGLTPARK